MVTKRARKSKKAEDLPAKGLNPRQAKRVKGGFVIYGAPNPANAASDRLLVPAVQKVRE